MFNRLAVACLALAGLAVSAMPAAAQTLAEIKTKGYLQIATSGAGAPYTYVDAKNELVGYDIDWAAVIGKELGVEVRWSRMPFSGLLPALQAGQVDMVMSAVRVTEERAKAFDFSIPYAYEATVAIVPATDKTAMSFDVVKGKVVAAVANSFQEEAVKKIGGYKELLSLKSGPDIYLALKSGQAEVAVTGMSAAGFYLQQGNTDIRIAGEGVGLSPQGIVFRKGSGELKAAVDAIIAKGKADGTYQKLFKKNIGVDAPADPK